MMIHLHNCCHSHTRALIQVVEVDERLILDPEGPIVGSTGERLICEVSCNDAVFEEPDQ